MKIKSRLQININQVVESDWQIRVTKAAENNGLKKRRQERDRKNGIWNASGILMSTPILRINHCTCILKRGVGKNVV